MLRYSIRVLGDSVGKGNILGGDIIGHCEERSYERVSVNALHVLHSVHCNNVDTFRTNKCTQVY
jgi:hypothetical protein